MGAGRSAAPFALGFAGLPAAGKTARAGEIARRLRKARRL